MKGSKLVRQTRLALNQTQTEFAETLGVSLRQVQYLEKGEKTLEPPLELAVLYLHEHQTEGETP